MRKSYPSLPALSRSEREEKIVAWTSVAMAGALLLALTVLFPDVYAPFIEKGLRTLGGVLAIAGILAVRLIRKA